MTTRMLQRRGDAAEWTAQNPILGDGEIGVERDTGEVKIGNGVTHWNDLAYAFPSAAALAAKADLVGGKVPSGQLPAITTGEHVTVANQAAMLALTAAQVQPGDIAIRTDQSGHRYLLADPDPSVLGNWIALETPGGVTSVQGYSGAVVLAKADLGLGNVDNTSDINKPVSTAQAAADATKQPLAAPLTSIAGLALAGNAAKVLTVKADASGYELDTPAAGGGGLTGIGTFHGARVYNSTNQTIATAGAIVTWDSENYDTDNYHSVSSQTSRFTIPAGMAGKYNIRGFIEWATASANGNRQVGIYKNGVVAAWGTISFGDASRPGAISVETTLDLAVGDYIELFAFQNSGGPLNIQTIGAGVDSRFELELVAPSGGIQSAKSVFVYPSVDGNIPNAAWTAIPFDTERYDTDGFHDNVTNNTRFTIPVGGAGKYLFVGSVDFKVNVTGQRSVGLYRNGALIGHLAYGISAAQGEVIVNGSLVFDAVDGDYFELYAYQTSGVVLGYYSGGTNGTKFIATRLGAGLATPVTLVASSPTETPLTLKGQAGQTADILKVQDSTGATLASINAAGALTARGARAYLTAAQSLANNATTAVTLDGEDFDTNSLHDLVTNNSRILLNQIGLWLVTGVVSFVNNATGFRTGLIYLNGFQNSYTVVPAVNGQETNVAVHALIKATAITNYVELRAYQNSGVALNINPGGSLTWLSATFMGAA